MNICRTYAERLFVAKETEMQEKEMKLMELQEMYETRLLAMKVITMSRQKSAIHYRLLKRLGWLNFIGLHYVINYIQSYARSKVKS